MDWSIGVDSSSGGVEGNFGVEQKTKSKQSHLILNKM